MRSYPDTADAVTDALRLSRTMTYKNALAGLNVGGGKAVLIGDPTRDKTEALLRALGRYVDSLGGRYITAEDMGTDVNDMEHAYRETEHVVGVLQSTAVPATRRRSRLRRAAGPDGDLEQQVRQRGSRQVQFRRAGPWATSAWNS